MHDITKLIAPFELDHIAVAVKTIDEGYGFYKTLGFPAPNIEVVESEGVKTGSLWLENQTSIELLEPLNEQSPVAKFLQKRGPGIHHIALRVKGLDAILQRLKAAGVKLINETAKVGANQCRIAFVHPQSTGGILLELSEKIG